MVDIDILWEVEEEKNIENMLKHVVEACLEEEGVTNDVVLSVVVTDNEHIRELNREHRDKDSATDVLSFPMYEPEEFIEIKSTDETIDIGDIVISRERVEEQGEEYGHGFRREFCYLTAHGMFHLMGYDHMNEEEKAVMRMKEENALKRIVGEE